MGTFGLLVGRTARSSFASWGASIVPHLVFGALIAVLPLLAFEYLGIKEAGLGYGGLLLMFFLPATVYQFYWLGLGYIAKAAADQIATDKEERMLDVLRVFGATPKQYYFAHAMTMFLITMWFMGFLTGGVAQATDSFVLGPQLSQEYAQRKNISVPSYWMETAFGPLFAALCAVGGAVFAGIFVGVYAKEPANASKLLTSNFILAGLLSVVALVAVELYLPTRTSWYGIWMQGFQDLPQDDATTGKLTPSGASSPQDRDSDRQAVWLGGRDFQKWAQEEEGGKKFLQEHPEGGQNLRKQAMETQEKNGDGFATLAKQINWLNDQGDTQGSRWDRLFLLYEYKRRPEALWSDEPPSKGAARRSENIEGYPFSGEGSEPFEYNESLPAGMTLKYEKPCPEFTLSNTLLNMGSGFLFGTLVPGASFLRVIFRGLGFVWVRHSGLDGKLVWMCAMAKTEEDKKRLTEEGVSWISPELAKHLQVAGIPARDLHPGRHYTQMGRDDGQENKQDPRFVKLQSSFVLWKDFENDPKIKPLLADAVYDPALIQRHIGRGRFTEDGKEISLGRGNGPASKRKDYFDPGFDINTMKGPFRSYEWWRYYLERRRELSTDHGFTLQYPYSSAQLLRESPAELAATAGFFDVKLPVLMDYLAAVLNVLFWISMVLLYDRARMKAETGVTADADTGTGNKVSPSSEDGGKQFALELKGLTKRYQKGGREFLANDNVSFSVKRAEIFGLLGHNGAGKTTLLSQITGLTPLTAGDAFVAGESLRSGDMRKVQSSIAFCPQNNPLLGGRFTLREHVMFFATLRGLDQNEAAKSIQQYAKGLGILEKLDTNCEELSGGQKRRMWVLCAFLGEAPLILLDEPTSGMDPQARRDFWFMLKEMARTQKRAVVFSTHYLEEADMLADRKVILAAGQVKALGTSHELKREYGAGYWINASIDASKSGLTEEQARANLAKMGTEVIAPMIPEMKTKNPKVNAYFLSYSVPWDAVSTLPAVLDKVDAKISDYRVANYSVEMTTLEEVFLRIGHESELEQGHAEVTEEQRERDIAVGRLPLRPRQRTFGGEVSAVWHLRMSQVSWTSFIFPTLMLGVAVWYPVYLYSESKRVSEEVKSLMAIGKKLAKEADEGTIGNSEAMKKLQNLEEEVGQLFVILGTKFTMFFGSLLGLLSAFLLLIPMSMITGVIRPEVSELGVLPHAQRHGLRRFAYHVGNFLYFYIMLGLVVATLVMPILVVYLLSADLAGPGPPGESKTEMVIAQVAQAGGEGQEKQRSKLEEMLKISPVFYCKWLIGFPIAGICVVLSGLTWGGLGSKAVIAILSVLTFVLGFVGSSPKGGIGGPPVGSNLFGGGWIPLTLLAPHLTGIIGNYIDVKNQHEANIRRSTPEEERPKLEPPGPEASEAEKAAYEKEMNLYDAFDPNAGGFYAMLFSVPYAIALLCFIDYISNRPISAEYVASHEWPVATAKADTRDSDVVAEESRVLKKYQGNAPVSSSEDAVVLADVRKRFYNAAGKEFWATQGVSLGVARGECFGLLGPNGAGKSTLFNLITGNSEVGGVSSGRILIKGEDCYADNFTSAYTITGLAPQFDKLWPKVTGLEHLRFYARIAGTYYPPTEDESNPGSPVGEEERLLGAPHKKDFGEELIARTLRDVSLSMKDANMPTDTYSGGMKRKLSVAITMITEPEIVYLDEMSAGVDLGAQRFLWNKLIHRPAGQTIITTTHSMMEADATCDRVGILVRGRIECLGQTEDIKRKYGSGYHLELVVPVESSSQEHEEVGDEAHSVVTAMRRSRKSRNTVVAEKGSEEKITAIANTIKTSLCSGVGLAQADVVLLEQLSLSKTSSRLTFELHPSQNSMPLAPIFRWCIGSEKNKQISEFALGQPTLEQVFLRFARIQEQVEGAKEAGQRIGLHGKDPADAEVGNLLPL